MSDLDGSDCPECELRRLEALHADATPAMRWAVDMTFMFYFDRQRLGIILDEQGTHHQDWLDLCEVAGVCPETRRPVRQEVAF